MIDVEIRLTTDPAQAIKGVSGFRKEWAALVEAVERPLKRVEALRQTQDTAKATYATIVDLRKQVGTLRSAMQTAGQPVKQLEKDYKAAERSLAAASNEFERQKTAIRAQRAELRAAGVDTRALAAEQQRLTAELGKQVSGGRNDQALGDAAGRLNVTQFRATSAALQQAQRDYQLLKASGTLTARELAVAQKALNVQVRETSQSLREMSVAQRSGIMTDRSALGTAVGVAGGGYAAVSVLRSYVDITDTAKKMEAQLRLATTTQEEFNKAQKDTFSIAQAAQAPLEDVVATYARLAPALDQIGRRGDAGAVVDALTKSLRINGATTAESSSTLVQFSQAMGSGVLRGQEFNSIAEAAPPLLRAFADGLGVPVGALRAMAADGLLTAEVITDLAVNALPALTEQAEKLPDTVDGALTRLRNDMLVAFGAGDTSGLIDSITKLREVLTDPAVVQGLTDMAAGTLQLATWAAQAAGEFSGLAKEIAFAAATASGYVEEVDRLEKTLAGVKAARNGGPLLGRPTATFFMSADQLDDWIEELEGKIARHNAALAGMSFEAYQAAQTGAKQKVAAERAAAAEKERIDQESFAAFSGYVSGMKSQQDDLVGSTEKALKGLVSAEKKAAKDIASAKKVQLETQKRYSTALAQISGGGNGQPSYGQAQVLKVAAQAALRDGNVEAAKEQAQAALKMLLDLQEAGENTYGFAGFIKSLKSIEDQADQINIDKAQKSFDDAKSKTLELKALLDEVKETVISVKLDDGELAIVQQKLKDLATLAGVPFKSTEQVLNPAAKPASPSSALQAGVNSSPGLPSAGMKLTPEPRPVVAVDVVPAGIRQDGANSFTNLPPVPVDIVPAGIRQEGANSFTNLPPVDVELQVDEPSAVLAEQAISALSTRFKAQMTIPIVPVVQGGNADSQIPGYATGTSSAPPGMAWVGERGRELVQFGGGERVFTHSQSMRLEAAMAQRSLPDIPAVPSIDRAGVDLSSVPHLGRMDISVGGSAAQTIYGEPGALKALSDAALKFGRTSRG